MSFDINNFLLVIVLLPIFGALHNGLVGRRANKDVVTAVALGSVVGAFLVSLACFGQLTMGGEDRIVHDVYEWFSITVGETRVPVNVRFVMDHLSGIMTVMVTGIGTLIHVYSVGYMKEDAGYWRFMTYLNLFMASMLILVLASSLPLMFVGWEGVGLCSYLLIGFWFENEDYAKAGRKAFVMNRIGDFGVLIGMFLLVMAAVRYGQVEAFEFDKINAVASRLGTADASFFALWDWNMSIATAAALFLFLGCAGKSAQLPLYVWLPDAMAGPTPVSALIHAATMVTAGVYLCVRLSPVISQSMPAMAFIALVGATTALIAASIALVQNQMKKILAYSTVSQLGFMFAAVGMGAFAGGFFHVFTHAFFKACLFLGAGSVMHAVHAHGDADIRYLGGLRKYLPGTHWTFAISTGAIAGLPLLSGFFSKDELLLGAATWGAGVESRWNWDLGWDPAGNSFVNFFASSWENITAGNWAGPTVGWIVFGVLVLAATMTAFYMFRLYFLTFHGEFKGGHAPGHEPHGDHGDEHADHEGGHGHAHAEPHESPATMLWPLYILGAGAGVVGFLGLPHLFHLPNWWSGWLTPQMHEFTEALAVALGNGAEHEAAVQQATRVANQVPSAVAVLRSGGVIVEAPTWVMTLAMVAGLAAGLGGFGLAFAWYFKADGEVPAKITARFPGVHRFLMDKWRVDEFYAATVVAPMKWLAVFAANLDRYLVDGLIAKVTATVLSLSGYLVNRTQTGIVYAYAGMMVVGLLGLGWWFVYPHPDPSAEPGVDSAEWSAAAGYGYEYRWDFDSDGRWDTEWSDSQTATSNYASLCPPGAAAGEGEHAAEGCRPGRFHGLVAIVQSARDMFGAREVVLGLGDDPTELPVGQSPIAVQGAIGSASSLSARYTRALRFDGNIDQVPEPDESGRRRVRLSFEILSARAGDAAEDGTAAAVGERLWGPVEREVTVDQTGAYSVLLGATSPLLRVPGRPVDGFVAVSRDGGAPTNDRVRLRARDLMVVATSGSPADSRDGIDDGFLTFAPGDSTALGASRVTIAVAVRGTVEVRNPLGNVVRDTETITLRVTPRGARAALTGSGAREAVR